MTNCCLFTLRRIPKFTINLLNIEEVNNYLNFGYWSYECSNSKLRV